jgi:glutaryl-CoA dehydrogenase
MTLLSPARAAEVESQPRTPDGDFYAIRDVVDKPELELLQRVRSFMDRRVAPIIEDYWARAEFPFEILPELRTLDIAGLGYAGFGCPDRGAVVEGLVTMELARVVCSIATFMGVHSGLAMGSIYLCGSEEQKQRWLPGMARLDLIGAFGLTEPDVGSGAAGGLTTTARRQGNTWVLNGAKKWIGNATFADLTVVWARDIDDNQVKGFVVEKGTAGFTPTKMEGKIALRAVQNAHIDLRDCRVAERNRLQGARSISRHCGGAAHNPRQRGVAGRWLRHGRVSARPGLRRSAGTVRSANRTLPTGSGLAGENARQCHRSAMYGAPTVAAPGGGAHA